jgi:hypothetical protein
MSLSIACAFLSESSADLLAAESIDSFNPQLGQKKDCPAMSDCNGSRMVVEQSGQGILPSDMKPFPALDGCGSIGYPS